MGKITTLNLLAQSFTGAESLLFYFIVMVLGVKKCIYLATYPQGNQYASTV